LRVKVNPDDDSMLFDQNLNDIGQIASEVKTGRYIMPKIMKHGESKNRTFVRKAAGAYSCRAVCVEFVLNNTILDDHPATIFVFKYTRLHSLQFSILDVLQAMGTAPSTSKRQVDEEAGLW
jgi:hypothetical protein